jgi:hypothetical protein
LVCPTEKPEREQELSERQVAEEYLLKKIREVKLDIRRLQSVDFVAMTLPNKDCDSRVLRGRD